MADYTYRVIEIVGSSHKGVDEAIRNALKRAHLTLRHLEWFEVTQTRGRMEDGQEIDFQVVLKVGFRIVDESAEEPATAVAAQYPLR